MEINEDLSTLFDNWQLMRMNIHLAAEEYRRAKRTRFTTEGAFRQSLHQHLQRKFKAEMVALRTLDPPLWNH